MSELDRCYTMLQELRSVIVGGALIHKNRQGSKHEGRRIRPTIGGFGGNCASNQSPFNNGRIEEWEEKKKEDRKIDKFPKVTNGDCPIESYQVCRVLVTIGKSYKIEVLCIVDDIDECHILLRRPWQCEVNGKYDLKKNLYFFSWEGRRIAMVPPKVTPQLPKPEVKVEEKIIKAERKSIKDKVCREKVFEVDEALDIENSRASSFQVRENHVDETKVNAVQDLSSPKTLFEVKNNKVADVLSRKTTLLVSIGNKIVGFNSIKELYASDENFGNIWMELKTKQHRDEFLVLDGDLLKVFRAYRLEEDQRHEEEDQRHEERIRRYDELKNLLLSLIQKSSSPVQSSPPRVQPRNREMMDSQLTMHSRRRELGIRALNGEAEQTHKIGWIKKGPALKVTEICKVPLAIGKHYNEFSGKTIAMLPLGVVSPKKALESKTLELWWLQPKVVFKLKKKG
ncbi:hypothetical protein Tco_0582775 [Tanacetum coccineum]